MRRAYQTDLSDAEWSHTEPHIPLSRAPGRPRVHTLREILDAIFYIVRSSCAWRLLPHEFPRWKTVHHYFGTWRIDGTWERIHAPSALRIASTRATFGPVTPNCSRMRTIGEMGENWCGEGKQTEEGTDP